MKRYSRNFITPAEWYQFPSHVTWHLDEDIPFTQYYHDPEKNEYFLSSRTAKFVEAYTDGFVWASAIPIAEEQPPSTKRAEILDTAKKLTTSDRNSTYGEPIDHLSHVADILNAYGYRGPGGRKIQAHDAPIFQIIVKLSRLNNGPTHMDSWTDISGYAAIGGEVAAIEADNESR